MYPPVNALTVFPSRQSNPDQFDTEADQHLSELELFQNQLNALAEYMENVVATEAGNAAAAANLTFLALGEAGYRANRRALRDRYSATGIAEYGLHEAGNVGQGLYVAQTAADANQFYWGKEGGAGRSRIAAPALNAHGALLLIKLAETGRLNTVALPAAPIATVEAGTTTTQDYNQGDFVVTGNSVYVCIEGSTSGTSLSNTSFFASRSAVTRSDLVFVEYWEELVTAKNIVYPYGAVQYAVATWQGIALANDQVSAEYSAYGAWQAAPTAGYGMVWSTASEADKKAFIQDARHNIFVNASGQLVQGRYRLRTAPGLGSAFTSVDGDQSAPRYDTYYIKAQGLSVELDADYSTTASEGYDQNLPDTDRGGMSNATAANSYGGECLYIPVALTARRNQGAYHPTHNPNGAAEFTDGAWDETAKTIDEIADCFRAADITGGSIASGISGEPGGTYFDGIYAANITDYRAEGKASDVVLTAAALKAIRASGFTGGEVRTLAETTAGASDGSLVVFRSGDQSVGVAAKPSDWFVPDDLAANGSEGAWQRVHYYRGAPVLIESGSLSTAMDLELDLDSSAYVLPNGDTPRRLTVRLRNIEQQVEGAIFYFVLKSDSVVYGTSGNGQTYSWTTFVTALSNGTVTGASGYAGTWRVLIGSDFEASSSSTSPNYHTAEITLENPYDAAGRKNGMLSTYYVSDSTGQIASSRGAWMWTGNDLGEALTGLKIIADSTTLTLDYEVYGE